MGIHAESVTGQGRGRAGAHFRANGTTTPFDDFRLPLGTKPVQNIYLKQKYNVRD